VCEGRHEGYAVYKTDAKDRALWKVKIFGKTSKTRRRGMQA